MSDFEQLKASWKKEEEMSFQGWNFSYLDNRWKEEPCPWDYQTILKNYLKPNLSLLDMGTGGGEFLLSLNHPYHLTSITEAWEPNIRVCIEKLSPLGINVYPVKDDQKLPIEDDSFDMIINRHESYDVSEIKRILKPNGIFITQQVGGKNNEMLSKKLIKDFVPQFPHLNLKNAVEELQQQSFIIKEQAEYFPYLHFYDVGAIVFFAKIIQWEFPHFSVDSCYDELCKLNDDLKDKSYIESFEHRYIIVAQNNK